MFLRTKVSEKTHQPAKLKRAGRLSEDDKIGKWGQTGQALGSSKYAQQPGESQLSIR